MVAKTLAKIGVSLQSLHRSTVRVNGVADGLAQSFVYFIARFLWGFVDSGARAFLRAGYRWGACAIDPDLFESSRILGLEVGLVFGWGAGDGDWD